MELKLSNNGTISSIELVQQINIFRQQEGRSNLRHADFLSTICDEFEEEIAERKISLSEYVDSSGKKNKMYNLTLSQAKQVLVRESKAVRKAVIKYIEALEEQVKSQVPQLTKEEQLILKIATTADKEQQAVYVQEYATLKWDNGYEIGHEQGYDKGHIDGYVECLNTETMSTSRMVQELTKKNGGSFSGARLQTWHFFQWLEYIGYGKFQQIGKKTYFMPNDKFIQEVVIEDKLAKVTYRGKRPEFRWTSAWVEQVNTTKIQNFIDGKKQRTFN